VVDAQNHVKAFGKVVNGLGEITRPGVRVAHQRPRRVSRLAVVVAFSAMHSARKRGK